MTKGKMHKILEKEEIKKDILDNVNIKKLTKSQLRKCAHIKGEINEASFINVLNELEEEGKLYYDEDGYLWYVGRVDDVIKSSGYRIGPFEIEYEIMKLPYVLECAVTSVPDPIRGQAIKASIVLVNGQEGTDKLKSEIMKSLKKNIASYKWPKILDFTKELPKTISGKIRRKEIKENDWNENADEK